MSQGPLPIVWAGVQAVKRGLWGAPLIEAMKDYNHVVGLKIVGECMAQERNGVTLTDELDAYGLPIPRMTYSTCDKAGKLADDQPRPFAGCGLAAERSPHAMEGRNGTKTRSLSSENE